MNTTVLLMSTDATVDVLVLAAEIVHIIIKTIKIKLCKVLTASQNFVEW